MEPLTIQDDAGNTLELLDDAGHYYSPNVDPDHILSLHTLAARRNDVLVVTYPKSGTHWVWEICSMLVHQSTKLMDSCIAHTEFLPSSLLDSIPSPRVLCTHLPYSRIPLDILKKRSKIVLVVRNPRDVAVSYYNFVHKMNIWDYEGSWNSFYSLFLDGKVPYNSWFEHTDAWLNVAKGENQNVYLLCYEDLHKNFREEIANLANFLEVDVTSQLLDAVEKETKFNNMKYNKNDFTIPLSKDGRSPIYRKGTVGDWKNVFTEEQDEKMEEKLEFWGLANEI